MPPTRAQVDAVLAGLKKPWEFQVDVYLGPPALPGGSPSFQLETIVKRSSAGRIMFNNRRRPGFFINFVLHDEPAYNYPPNLVDAVWSQAGSNCPNGPIWTVLWPMAVDHGTRTLTVYNANQAQFGPYAGYVGIFQYALNLVRGTAPRLLPLDPGGTDQNGNTN